MKSSQSNFVLDCPGCEEFKFVFYYLNWIQVGTEDTAMLSAIYSQLGNAYYTKGLYPQALEFHRNDLLLTRFV